jgi:hypothetical protein
VTKLRQNLVEAALIAASGLARFGRIAEGALIRALFAKKPVPTFRRAL